MKPSLGRSKAWTLVALGCLLLAGELLSWLYPFQSMRDLQEY